MKLWQYLVVNSLSVAAMILLILWMSYASGNQERTLTLQQQQQVINQGQLTQQVSVAVIRDLASLSIQNEKIRDLLLKHGISVTQNNSGGSNPNETR